MEGKKHKAFSLPFPGESREVLLHLFRPGSWGAHTARGDLLLWRVLKLGSFGFYSREVFYHLHEWWHRKESLFRSFTVTSGRVLPWLGSRECWGMSWARPLRRWARPLRLWDGAPFRTGVPEPDVPSAHALLAPQSGASNRLISSVTESMCLCVHVCLLFLRIWHNSETIASTENLDCRTLCISRLFFFFKLLVSSKPLESHQVFSDWL